ncbi:MAG: hypothetical protein ABS96_35020 [Lysobacteraceae bacterium SCN 69-123]|jgi:hypothetical protein|uniref:DUF2946 domain-containing protein n=1 Tax=Thermomonas fusca TaxID=215690 RepID=A0A5R9PCC4_9GAMM|nr:MULTISPECIES: hypothetical protein [Thermomonas]MBN8715977.1 hypothetical protein [Xanthomonadales bacterium]MBN8794140.1 hypothetical protein [Stenotrophomonas nitritireducens]ODU40496.1 MAG: hypothetical protein ABS96_35020 [Xanthomonadaceae bacterium SCN 69-123]MCL6620215.1 hypothetical protein [Thermomonas hydrothermalis]TLX20747.1 hypothetical protein E5S66_13145 [Thermomonas fusca]
MIRLRHRNWFKRTALLAMVALLWSQFALAGHGGCLDLKATTAAVAADADTHHDHGHGCGAELPSADEALCTAHCSEGDLSADSGRIPPVPPLLVGVWFSWFAVAEVADGGPGVTSTWVDSPPTPAWHRPTAHPAALLLI